MTTEEYLARMAGRIDALVKVCITLVVTHHDGRAILLASKLGDAIKAGQPKSANAQAYVEGMESVAQELQAALDLAAQAVRMRDLKPEGGH
jgi:hypothetical protein